jgi:peptidoglycan hydrolase-like protein with peptidoglycan-binding domain
MAASSLLVPLAIVASPGTALAAGCNSNAVGSWSNNCTVVEGDSGNLVRGVQAYADEIEGCGGIVDDGSFGPATLKAVKCLQVRLGVTADGSVGPITWSTMQADLSRTTTSGGWVYYGADIGAEQFRESTSTNVWNNWDTSTAGWVDM